MQSAVGPYDKCADRVKHRHLRFLHQILNFVRQLAQPPSEECPRQHQHHCRDIAWTSYLYSSDLRIELQVSEKRPENIFLMIRVTDYVFERINQ